MIDKAILDQIIPVPTLEAARAEAIAELETKGFAISGWRSGGVFILCCQSSCGSKLSFSSFLEKF